MLFMQPQEPIHQEAWIADPLVEQLTDREGTEALWERFEEDPEETIIAIIREGNENLLSTTVWRDHNRYPSGY